MDDLGEGDSFGSGAAATAAAVGRRRRIIALILQIDVRLHAVVEPKAAVE